MNKDEKMFYSSQEAVEYTGKSIATIKRAVRDKLLIGIMVDGRTRVFTKEELDTFKSIERKPGPKPKE